MFSLILGHSVYLRNDDGDDDGDDGEVFSRWQVDTSRDLYTQPASGPYSFVFVSKDWMTTTGRLLILIHGSGVVRAGQWARRSACFSHKLAYITCL